MKGKIAVFALLLFTAVFLVFGWVLLQDVIADHQLEEPDSIINGLH
ncbi:hypothetical protein ACFOGI_09745 [Virgibacillus xinjiangensis]|uniref:Uncharacterized protein n=1 Tax=Virgibacillus xinjiangensis TaxID=393090 RepID=A0ABV7CW08_9BACI